MVEVVDDRGDPEPARDAVVARQPRASAIRSTSDGCVASTTYAHRGGLGCVSPDAEKRRNTRSAAAGSRVASSATQSASAS